MRVRDAGKNNGRPGLVLAAWLVACTAREGPGPPPPPAPDAAEVADLASALHTAGLANAREPTGALVVRLAFGRADLDLYVTDPLQETVYFANTPGRSGGRLDADRACADAEPRVETVVFAVPLAGRYRIGVDHPGSCGPDLAPAAFVVEVSHGDGTRRREGVALPRRFEPIVLEFELP